MRTDIHRPSAIEPQDYEYVGAECVAGALQGDEGALSIVAVERARIQAHMARTGGRYSNHEHAGNCGVCGSVNAIYTVLFYHSKTNSYVRMGSDCAEKCEIGYDRRGVAMFRTSLKDALALSAGKRKAQALLHEAGLDNVWELYNATELPDEFEERTIRDIVRNVVKYGSLSTRQVSFLDVLLKKIPLRAAMRQAREAEKVLALPVPVVEGRMMVEGVVVSTSISENAFGARLVMTVKAADGWCVWGSAFCDVKKGDKVRFWASVTVSEKDPKFGFFKRPTKGEVL
jgi:hypothetical protein